MTSVDTRTGEIVETCTAFEAADLTQRIKTATSDLWALLTEAHQRQAWVAMGYGTWAEYVRAEFDMTKRHANRLIAQGEVIRAIEAEVAEVVPTGTTDSEVGPDGPTEPSPRVEIKVSISEAVARELKPQIAAVKAAIRKAIDALKDPTQDQADAIVEQVIRETRNRLAGERSAARLDKDYVAAVRDFPDLAHYADRKQRAVDLAQSLRAYDPVEREMRLDNLRKSIAAEKRGGDEPAADPGADAAERIAAMFDAVTEALSVIRKNGAADAAVEARDYLEPLLLGTYADQFLDLSTLTAALASVLRAPAALRSVK